MYPGFKAKLSERVKQIIHPQDGRPRSIIQWAGEQSESGCATQGLGLQFSGLVSGLKEDERPKRIVEWWAGEWAEGVQSVG